MNFTISLNNIANSHLNNNVPQDLEAKKLHILMKMKESKMYWKLKQHLFKEMKAKQQQDIFSVKKIQQASYQSGIEEQLKQLIINCANRSLKSEPIKFDPQDFINQARVKWTEIILKNYDYAQEKLKNYKPNGGQNNDADQSEILYVYDEKNFFNFMITIKNTSAVNLNMSPNTCMKVNFITPSLNDLRQKYDLLQNSDNIENKNSNEYKLREKRCKTLAENEALESEIETLAQGGLSNGERVELYMKYFGIESSSFKHFAKLEEEVDKKELMFDEILLMDSEEVADNDCFFIFQETVERITQAFLRDKEVRDKLKIYSIATEKLNANDLQKIPPCFMIPMKSISMLVAPLGFCSNKVDIMYMIFKEFYCNFYCHLHSISSQPNGILFLCCIFEELMAHACNKVMNHLASINIEPLRIAFPWFFYCFIGFTTVENIFLLLDRIIGYRSLDILPLFAVGVFKLYQNEILKCKNAADLEKIFSQKIEFPFINCVRSVFQ